MLAMVRESYTDPQVQNWEINGVRGEEGTETLILTATIHVY